MISDVGCLKDSTICCRGNNTTSYKTTKEAGSGTQALSVLPHNQVSQESGSVATTGPKQKKIMYNCPSVLNTSV